MSARPRVPRWLAVLALALACTVLIGGCGRKSTVKPNEPAKLLKITPSITVSRVWSANIGKGEGRLGIRQTPAVADGRVYAAAVSGGVHALELATGNKAWHYRSKLQLTGGPGAGDGLVVVGGLGGEVIALDATTGTQRWQTTVSSAVLAPPVIGQGFVLVSSDDGRVTALDADSGERRWFWNKELPALSVRGGDAPALGAGYAFIGNADGSVTALSLADGRMVWEQAVADPDGRSELERMADVDGQPLLDGSVLYASSYKQRTVAIDAGSGRTIWSADHGGSNRVGISIDKVIVADPAGTVWALDRSGGSALWQQDALARRGIGSAAVQGNYAVVADMDGYLHWLNLSTGEFVARARAGRDAVKGALVVVDGLLVVQNVEGKISVWRING